MAEEVEELDGRIVQERKLGHRLPKLWEGSEMLLRGCT